MYSNYSFWNMAKEELQNYFPSPHLEFRRKLFFPVFQRENLFFRLKINARCQTELACITWLHAVIPFHAHLPFWKFLPPAPALPCKHELPRGRRRLTVFIVVKFDFCFPWDDEELGVHFKGEREVSSAGVEWVAFLEENSGVRGQDLEDNPPASKGRWTALWDRVLFGRWRSRRRRFQRKNLDGSMTPKGSSRKESASFLSIMGLQN